MRPSPWSTSRSVTGWTMSSLKRCHSPPTRTSAASWPAPTRADVPHDRRQLVASAAAAARRRRRRAGRRAGGGAGEVDRPRRRRRRRVAAAAAAGVEVDPRRGWRAGRRGLRRGSAAGRGSAAAPGSAVASGSGFASARCRGAELDSASDLPPRPSPPPRRPSRAKSSHHRHRRRRRHHHHRQLRRARGRAPAGAVLSFSRCRLWRARRSVGPPPPPPRAPGCRGFACWRPPPGSCAKCAPADANTPPPIERIPRAPESRGCDATRRAAGAARRARRCRGRRPTGSAADALDVELADRPGAPRAAGGRPTTAAAASGRAAPSASAGWSRMRRVAPSVGRCRRRGAAAATASASAPP